MIALLLAAADDEWSYVSAAYLIVVVALLAYAVWVIRRGRRVGRQLPSDERRWM